MSMIGVNNVIFPATIWSMTTAGNAINGTITTWVPKGEKATAFTQFTNDYIILQIIIDEYKKLVLKDIKTIDKIGAEIIKVDGELPKYWR